MTEQEIQEEYQAKLEKAHADLLFDINWQIDYHKKKVEEFELKLRVITKIDKYV